MEIPKSFLGYKRENGRAGTRNHVIILPVDDISNACAEAVANNIKGTIALPHSYGRLQFGADLELHFRTMIGTAKNPNVAAAIIIAAATFGFFAVPIIVLKCNSKSAPNCNLPYECGNAIVPLILFATASAHAFEISSTGKMIT